MINYKQKLTSLLCEVEEVKRDIEELRFGTKIKYSFYEGKIIKLNINGFDFLDNTYGYNNYISGTKLLPTIIGNPLEEKHLRMYCKKNKIAFLIGQEAEGGVLLDYVILLDRLSYPGTKDEFIIKMNDTKSFDNQDDKVYEQIFNYLNKLKG